MGLGDIDCARLRHAGWLHVPATFAKVALPATPGLLGLMGAVPVVAVLRRRRA